MLFDSDRAVHRCCTLGYTADTERQVTNVHLVGALNDGRASSRARMAHTTHCQKLSASFSPLGLRIVAFTVTTATCPGDPVGCSVMVEDIREKS